MLCLYRNFDLLPPKEPTTRNRGGGGRRTISGWVEVKNPPKTRELDIFFVFFHEIGHSEFAPIHTPIVQHSTVLYGIQSWVLGYSRCVILLIHQNIRGKWLYHKYDWNQNVVIIISSIHSSNMGYYICSRNQKYLAWGEKGWAGVMLNWYSTPNVVVYIDFGRW